MRKGRGGLGVALIGGVILWSGCAFRYSDRRSGVEHLWGIGQMRLHQQSAGNGLVTVTTGVCVPGLCLEIGSDQFGFNFGWLGHERLVVVATNAADGLCSPVAWPFLPSVGRANGRWTLGHLQMRSVPSAGHFVVMTGKALVGVGARLGCDGNSFGIGLDSRQQTVIYDPNIRLEMDQDVPRWPGLDLFSTRVAVSLAHEENRSDTIFQEEP